MAKPPPNDRERREYRTDPLKMRRLRVSAGMSVADFTKASGLDRTTAGKVLKGTPIFLSSIAQAARQAFGIEDSLEVLHPDELLELGVRNRESDPDAVLEWRIEEYLTEWRKTSNGLQYQVLHLKHRFLADRDARGKRYELRHLPSREVDRLEGRLRRHIEVCDRVGPHPNLAENITAAETGGVWWVIDKWHNAETLSHRLAQDGCLDSYTLRHVMTGVAEGLHALHKAEVIRREVSPDQILLRESDDRAVLVDLELAKLTDGAPTVAPDEWPEDPYRALEVGGDATIDVRADVYGWGRVFVQAATDTLPERGSETLPSENLPDAVRQVVLKSVQLPRSKRPKSFAEVLKVLRAWR